jgi:hypothetical protein
MENGECECGAGKIATGNTCMDTGIFAAIIVSVVAVIAMIALYFFLQYKRAKNDEAWQVKVEELHFGQHAEVIGQGSFGVVLLAEYRGTKVAIKRVIPLKKQKAGGSNITGSGLSIGSLGNKSKESNDHASSGSGSVDLEEGKHHHGTGIGSSNPYSSAGCSASATGSTSSGDDLDFLGHMSFGRSRGKLAKMLPWLFPDDNRYNASILGTVSGTANSSRTVTGRLCPWFDDTYSREQEFITEMRLLSRLRHPCKYTVPLACFALAYSTDAT